MYRYTTAKNLEKTKLKHPLLPRNEELKLINQAIENGKFTRIDITPEQSLELFLTKLHQKSNEAKERINKINNRGLGKRSKRKLKGLI